MPGGVAPAASASSDDSSNPCERLGLLPCARGARSFRTEAPLTPEDVAKNSFVQFPIINGAVVPVVNLDGIKPDELTLDGPTLAKIYLGEIKKWDDPAIKKLNPSVKLPSAAIAVVHRADGSGTTFIWTNYLSKVSPEWKSKVGVNTAVEWPVGIGAKGNEGVSNNAAQTKGSIGYVEYAYAKQNKMAYVKMINHAGKTVSPTSEAFLAAAAGAQWGSAKDFYVILTDAPGDKSWPIVGSTFILMHSAPNDTAAAVEALKFFAWGYKNGKGMADDLDYVPMPDNVVALIEKTWKEHIKANGKSVY
jgi:phosphate transport system substrate-binding protein